MNKIPINIITGFLGVGKTTALQNILKSKPADERWALIINEFGTVSIDHTAFAEADENALVVKEVAGGCICCTANLPMQMTLNLVIRQVKPHRILIEPTGIAHPETVLDLLQSRFLKDVLDVRATVCLVDPRQWNTPKYREHETFIDQITLADVLIANKTDLAGDALTQDFLEWGKELFPPKMRVEAVTKGQINPAWLDETPAQNRKALHPNAHQHEHNHQSETPLQTVTNEMQRFESHGFGNYGCGWIFPPDVVFDLAKLKKWVATYPQTERIKGAFRTGIDWVLINAVRGEFTVEFLAYRRDSRAEMISSQPIPWQNVEDGLKSCSQAPQPDPSDRPMGE